MKIIECPRDAIQGLTKFISTKKKINYINALFSVGFDTIDFGSFVSSKLIPQMRDTPKVLEKLKPTNISKLLAIVANSRGAKDASLFDRITYLGFPLSLSETFQKLNTGKSIEKSLEELMDIQNICLANDKQLVIYLSMGFGNPYGDAYNSDMLEEYVEKLNEMNIRTVSLSDTLGMADKNLIKKSFTHLIPKFPKIEIGAHLHSTPDAVNDKLEILYQSGCRRVDGALGGFGGCPLAKNELVGNLATEKIVKFLLDKNELVNLNLNQLEKCVYQAQKIMIF